MIIKNVAFIYSQLKYIIKKLFRDKKMPFWSK